MQIRWVCPLVASHAIIWCAKKAAVLNCCCFQVEELGLACAHKAGCRERRCITPAGVAAICQMTRLVHLDLSGHETMTDACIQLIAERLPSLSYLDIRAHASLPDSQSHPKCTDTGIAPLRDLQQLRSLSLSNAQVTYPSAQSIQQGFVRGLGIPSRRIYT